MKIVNFKTIEDALGWKEDRKHPDRYWIHYDGREGTYSVCRETIGSEIDPDLKPRENKNEKA